MYASTSEIVRKANHIVKQCGTRDPKKIADELGIVIRYYPFNVQRGAYKVIMRNRFMFVKKDLPPVMKNIVLLHELGHDALHRKEATKVGGFEEFTFLMFETAEWSTKQTSLQRRLHCPVMTSWSLPNRAMMFSRLLSAMQPM